MGYREFTLMNERRLIVCRNSTSSNTWMLRLYDMVKKLIKKKK